MAQYCYYNGGSPSIKKVAFNGAANTYRKIIFNGQSFTLSTWYSGTCKNGYAEQSTFSSKNVTNSAYKHIVTQKNYSKNGSGNWVSYGAQTLTTWTMPYGGTDDLGVESNAGYGSYGYMSYSFYTGNNSYRTYYSFTPPSKSKAQSMTWITVSTYLYASNIKHDINFSYSTSSIANATAFAPSNYESYYDLRTHPLNGVTANPNYTISRSLAGHWYYNYVSTFTF